MAKPEKKLSIVVPVPEVKPQPPIPKSGYVPRTQDLHKEEHSNR